MRQEFRLDADTGVADGNLYSIFCAHQPRIDAAAWVREFDRVRQQVPQDLLYAVGIRKNHGASVRIDLQSDSLRLSARPDHVNSGMKDRGCVDRAGLQIESAG